MGKILVTGSSGVLGKEMIYLLEKESIEFQKLKCRFETLDSNIKDLELINPSTIFHFGALTKLNKEPNIHNFYENNVLLTAELSKYSIRKKYLLFIFLLLIF